MEKCRAHIKCRNGFRVKVEPTSSTDRICERIPATSTTETTITKTVTTATSTFTTVTTKTLFELQSRASAGGMGTLDKALYACIAAVVLITILIVAVRYNRRAASQMIISDEAEFDTGKRPPVTLEAGGGGGLHVGYSDANASATQSAWPPHAGADDPIPIKKKKKKKAPKAASNTFIMTIPSPLGLGFRQDEKGSPKFLVTKLKPGGNAEATGKIKVGYFIVSVNGVPVAGQDRTSLTDVIKAAGAADGQVTIEFQDPKKPNKKKAPPKPPAPQSPPSKMRSYDSSTNVQGAGTEVTQL